VRNVDHLPIAVMGASELAPHTFHRGRQHPILEGRAVAQGAGLAGEHVMPGVVDRIAAAERARMFGDDPTVLADHDPVGIGMNLDVPVEEPSKASQPDSRSKFECSAAAWGPFNEFGLVANRSQPELFAGFPHYSAGAHRYRSGFVAWPFSPMRRRLIN